MIISGSEDGHLYGWDLNSQKLQIKLPIIKEDPEQKVEPEKYRSIFQVDYSHDHEILAVCGNFADLRIINGDLSSLMTQSR